MSQHTYIITHIPKTAGSSLRTHLQKYLKDQTEFIHLANNGHKKANRLNLKPFHLRPQKSRNLAKVIFGHQVDNATKNLIHNPLIKEVVIFREPAAWEVSRYNQYANRVKKSKQANLTFADWCNTKIVNKIHSQFDWFLINYSHINIKNLCSSERDEVLVSVLSNFDYVLFVEDFPDCLEEILDSLSVPTSLTKSTNVVGLDKPNCFNDNHKNALLLSAMTQQETKTYDLLYSIYGNKNNA